MILSVNLELMINEPPFSSIKTYSVVTITELSPPRCCTVCSAVTVS